MLEHGRCFHRRTLAAAPRASLRHAEFADFRRTDRPADDEKGPDGKATHWLRLGTAFTNKDESLNAYIDSLPFSAFSGKQLKLCIREFTEEDLRRKDDFKSRSSGFGDQPAQLGRQPLADDRAPF